jgi:hypothetical protein
MSTITVARPNVTSEEVSEVLREGLSARYNVLPGMRMTRNPVGNPRPGQSDTILVGIGSNRVIRTQVTIVRRSGQTDLRISPGGISWELLLNTLGSARKIRRVLSDASNLR